MSTRSVIGRETPGGGFSGRYHHWDGCPSGLGQALYRLFPSFYDSDLEAMSKALIDGHPGGWSTLIPDWTGCLGPDCCCHSRTGEPKTEPVADEWLDPDRANRSGCEFAYVLTRDETDRAILRILENTLLSGRHFPGG